MASKRTCKRICKRYSVKKPTGKGRHGSGQGMCQTCGTWIDYAGAHEKSGIPATEDSQGWFCNCCGCIVRRHPRNIEYEVRTRSSNSFNNNEYGIDLTYFNKLRAQLLRDLGRSIAEEEADTTSRKRKHIISISKQREMESEFDVEFEYILKVARANTPNKASLIVELEMIRQKIGRIPTKEEMDRLSKFDISQYEEEFESWEHLLERLGYDPWYRCDKKHKTVTKRTQDHNHVWKEFEFEISKSENLEVLRQNVLDGLESDPIMLHLFSILDQSITKYNKVNLQLVLDRLR